MTGDDDFRIRPGRIRSPQAQRVRPFVAQALAATLKAGGTVSRAGKISKANRSHFGRGKRATVVANRLITGRTRGAVIKARVVRTGLRGASLSPHIAYLRRDGVTRDGEKARLFGSAADEADGKAFAERCKDDRHHFRFIVSPDDAPEMADLRGFARDLMAQAEYDLGTRLDWVAVDHWNTGHPHLHILVRGVRDDGENLVIARDYIKQGLRDRARDLITRELGPRTDHEIRHALEQQVESERWTALDRQLRHDGGLGLIDLAPRASEQPDAFHVLKMGRLRKLEALGLARELGPGQWVMAEEAEATLRALGERGDIIKRIHRSLAEQGIERAASGYVLAGEQQDAPIIGRLAERGLDDELKGTAFAIVDGTDGRTHHLRLPDLDAAGDSAPGSIVELRRFTDKGGRHHMMLATRSDYSLEQQVTAAGATWLDRQAVSRDPVALAETGFGAEVREALARRTDHLAEQGLARRVDQRVVYARNLLDTLRRREVDALGEILAKETGLTFEKPEPGSPVSGLYRRRFALASGRFAMIDDGLGFKLVPWSPAIEKRLGQQVNGVGRPDGGIDWSPGRKKGLGL